MKRQNKENKFSFTALKFTAVLGLAYAYQVLTGFDPGFNASASPWWKFFTSVMGHSDLQHLFNNLFFIGLFGSIFERLASSRAFLATFFVSALFANISAFIFFPDSFIIGASGGAMGILSALAVYRPRKIGLALGVPAPMWFVLLSYIFINFAGLSGVSGVAHEAHLLGIFVGASVGLRLRDRPYLEEREEGRKREEDDLDNWRRRIRRWEEKYMLD